MPRLRQARSFWRMLTRGRGNVERPPAHGFRWDCNCGPCNTEYAIRKNEMAYIRDRWNGR